MKLQNFMDHTPSSASSTETTPSEDFRISSSEMTFNHLQENSRDQNSNQTLDASEYKILEGDSVTLKSKIKEGLHLELLKSTPHDIFDIIAGNKMAPNPRPQDGSELTVVRADDTSADIVPADYDVDSDSKSQRTISEIKSSLEQKVRKLREGRGVLEKKIQMSQEDDATCTIQDKSKSDLLSRKEKLRRIISDMRRKLEDQGKRLQSNYNTILAIQRNVLRCRSFTMKRKFITDTVVKESPF